LERADASPSAGPGYDDLVQAGRIEPTSHGRLAVASSRPAISISANQFALGNIFNIDVAAIERDIDKSDAPDEEKREAKSRLHLLASTAADIGKGAAGELLVTSLRVSSPTPRCRRSGASSAVATTRRSSMRPRRSRV
jgi:hypothetical protein